MDKYLFTDGSSGVREVQSQQELLQLIESAAQRDTIRIWVFNSNEWISYTEYAKRFAVVKKQSVEKNQVQKIKTALPIRRRVYKTLLFTLTGAAVFFVYNFTRIEWKKAAPVSVMAARPANVAMMDIDSLIQELEATRGQRLDKITRTNLRLRNTWPDRILLQLNAERDTSSAGSRFHDIELTIDNTTGYNADYAIVKLTAWKNNEVSTTDTFRFAAISYATPAKRKINNVYKADSLSVSFTLIKAKSFNFCYAADKKSNYGNDTDKWFCRE